jgi:hypothetical protein
MTVAAMAESDWVETMNELSNEEFMRDTTKSLIPQGSFGEKARVAVIRTSDRLTFKRCRRRWGWGSHLRHNLGPKQKATPLWLGSGFHFALEDMHSTTPKFGSAADAFRAYVNATRKQNQGSLPDDWQETLALGIGMLDYYQHEWLKNRDPLTTFVYNDVPQVEVNFRIPIPFDATHWGYDEVVYSGTIDRVIIDENGILWLLEYKTAKSIATLHYSVDPQVGAYIWAARHMYPGYEIGGVIYQQHKKAVPEEPRILANGKLSTNKQQATTHSRYRKVVKEIYGDPQRAPGDVIATLNHFAYIEDASRDAFIRRDKIFRNEFAAESEGSKILMEVREMLDPELPLYPNPTRDCTYQCPFISPCVSIDDGSDWQYELEQTVEPRERSYDSWRTFLPGGRNHTEDTTTLTLEDFSKSLQE